MYSYSLYSIQRWNRIFQLYISQYSNSVGTKYNINITLYKYNFVNRWWFNFLITLAGEKMMISWSVEAVDYRTGQWTGLLHWDWSLPICGSTVHSTALSSLSKSVQFYREEPSQTSQDWMINTVFTFYFTEQSSRHFPEAQVIKESDLRSWHLHWVFTVLCF